MFKYFRVLGEGMPKGLKQTSSVVSIGFGVTETAPNIFTEGATDLNLDPLNREVFVVMGINLDPSEPEAIAATNTGVTCALTTTSQDAMPTLAVSNCLAVQSNSIRAAGFVDGGVGFQKTQAETPMAGLEYIGIIATSDFFVQVQGNNNTGVRNVAGKMYGYRATAGADIFAALVQSEVLSA